MRNIIFGSLLTIAALLSGSCAKEMDTPYSTLISGMWANDVWADRYICFEGGYMREYVSEESYYVKDMKIWNSDGSNYKFYSTTKYSIIDGNIVCEAFNEKLLVQDSVMIIGDQKYFLITDFNKDPYSKILPSSENLLKYSYAAESVEWNYSIENPVEGQSLEVVPPDWVTDVLVTDGKIAFNVPESKEDKQGKFILHYGTADDVEIFVTQTASRSIIVNKTYSCDYSASDRSVPYTIENPKESFVVEAEVDKDWVSDLNVNEGVISFKVSENNTGSSRIATLKLSYPEAKDVEVVITQIYSASSISVSPTSGFCDYVGGDFEFTYTIANPREGESLTANSGVSWITDVVVSGNKVTYKVPLNTIGMSRTGNINLTYAGKTSSFNVTQSAAEVTMSSASASHDYSSATLSFDYSITDRQSSLELTLNSNVDWITGLTDNGTNVSYNVSENNSGSSRTGKITLTYAGVNKVFTITQQRRHVILSSSESANCYIVSSSGYYSFNAVKGNSSTSVGSVSYAQVLWESFGTSTTPSVGDLVKNVSYADGYIAFDASDKKGNAVIAAKDASGNILWSWHIWLTDQPQGQEYYNNAGTMMDRNLGATSATPGDVGALGLLYQWGRKDPFLGSSSISSSTLATSTLTWPSAVESTSSTGTIDYVTSHPTTFVTASNFYIDWYYGSSNNTLWQSEKTIYDPCPAGWRVPDGGDDGVWSTTLGSSSRFEDEELYDSTNKGMNFSSKFGSASTIWYPASGCRYYSGGGLCDVGYFGSYWSVTPDGGAYSLYFNGNGLVDPSLNNNRALGYAVRCLQE